MGKFSERSARLILSLIRSGQTKQVAARGGGVTVATLNRWLREPDKAAFAKKYAEMEAEAEEDLVQRIQHHAQKDWKAAKWLLTHRYPHWREEAKTSQEHREALDRLRVKKGELEVEFAELRLAAMKNADGDQDLLAVLNTPALDPPSEKEKKQPN